MNCERIEEGPDGPHGAIATLSGCFGGASFELKMPAIHVSRVSNDNGVPDHISPYLVDMTNMNETGIINTSLAVLTQKLNDIDRSLRPSQLKFEIGRMEECLRPIYGFTALKNVSKFSTMKNKAGYKDLYSHWDPILGSTWDLLRRVEAIIFEIEFHVRPLGYSGGKLEGKHCFPLCLFSLLMSKSYGCHL